MPRISAILFLILLLALPSVLFAQTAVRTEAASGLAAYADTSRLDTITSAKFLTGIFIGSWTATDTISIWSGVYAATLKFRFITGATAPTVPGYFPLGVRVDSLIWERTGDHPATLIYRTGW